MIRRYCCTRRKRTGHRRTSGRCPPSGAGVYELRASDSDGIARLMYIASSPRLAYVLHVFQKNIAEDTAGRSIDKAGQNAYEDLMRERAMAKSVWWHRPVPG